MRLRRIVLDSWAYQYQNWGAHVSSRAASRMRCHMFESHLGMFGDKLHGR